MSETLKKSNEKKGEDIEHFLRKGLGFYSTGFIIASDALAFLIKRTLLMVHDFIPLVLLYRGVDILHNTKDSIGKSLSEFTYCPKCSGNGSIFKHTDDGKAISEVCSMCHGKGRLDIDLSKERCSDDICITREAPMPLAPIGVVEEMIKSAQIDAQKTKARCSRCSGKGYIMKASEDGHSKEEVCPLCHGMGKDYAEQVRELMNRCAGDLVEIGYEVDDAWKKCRQIYPTFFNKEKLLKEVDKKESSKK